MLQKARKRIPLTERIINTLEENGGTFTGSKCLRYSLDASPRYMRIALARLSAGGRVRIRPGRAGRGHVTVMELVQ